MARKFEEWWNTVPADLKQKARKGDESNKPLLNQINYVLLHLHLAGKHDAKPTHHGSQANACVRERSTAFTFFYPLKILQIIKV
jgi:hypothetical protein